MVLKKQLILWISVLLPVISVEAQELDVAQGEYVRSTNQMIKEVELTQRDSMVYGAQLVDFTKHCYKYGFYPSGAIMIDLAFQYINDERKRVLQKKEKLMAKSKLRFGQKLDLYFIEEELALTAAAMGDILANYAISWDFLGYIPDKIEGLYTNSLAHYKLSQNNDVRGNLEAYVYAARYFDKMEKWSVAEEYYLEALKMQRKYRKLNAEEANLLQNQLITHYIRCSKIAEAEDRMFSLSVGKTPLSRAVTLNNRANVAICKKEYGKAADFIKQAIAQYRVSLPTLSKMIKTTLQPEFMSGLAFTATLYSQQGRIDEALIVYELLQHLLTMTMKEYIPYMVYTDKSQLWFVMRDCFNQMQQFAMTHHFLDGAAGFLYDNNLLKKNIFLNSPVELVDPKIVGEDEYLKQVRAQIDMINSNVISWHTQRGSDFIAKTKNDLLSMAHEREYLNYLRKKQWRKPYRVMDWQAVQATMKPGDAVLDFIDWASPGGSKRYGVIILTKKSKAPVFVRLYPERHLKNMLNDKAKKVEFLETKLWALIEANLPEVSTLFISPTGLINTISFAGFKSNGKYLCEKYNLHYLLNSEDLSLVNAEKDRGNYVHSPKNIYLFGAADFGLASHMISDVRSQGFGYLPGSKDEINSISEQLNAPWKAYKFIGKDATEKNLRALSWKPDVSVLHISTHGFYLPYDPSILTRGINNNGKSSYFDPLARTGFMLSGANYAWKDPIKLDPLNDCIVTAMELGYIQLPYTELVVLSACNTGLGEIKDGEGVAGMQQTLRMSGVRSMLLSLDDIPDRETAELMTSFYKYWQGGYSKSEAFIRAQRMMKDKYPHHPAKWAGFILVQ